MRLYLPALPVQKNLLTGIWITVPRAETGDETLLTCFTSTKALACWYKSTNTDSGWARGGWPSKVRILMSKVQ